MASRHILIVGATGQQGSATIAALQHQSISHDSLRILALTRSSTAAKAKALVEKHPGITLVEGDSRVPDLIFKAYPEIDSIFLVTIPPDEEAQSMKLIDAAIAHGISHIIFSSVDRGGDTASWENPTDVPHFASKHRIELHLRAKTMNTKTKWTILRPTSFMDSYSPGVFGQMMAGLWATMPADCGMQLISTHDIGLFAAKALMHPDAWKSRAVGLAGDKLTMQDADDVFQRVTGKPLPRTWGIAGWAVRRFIADARLSMEYFETTGFKADIAALRSEEPRLQTFEMWLRQSSNWTIADADAR